MNYKFYEGMLELSDNRTLWEINKEFSFQEYSWMVQKALQQISQQYDNVEIELLGRSGKHVCIDDDEAGVNRARYWEIRQSVLDYEQRIIHYFNCFSELFDLKYAPQSLEYTYSDVELCLIIHKYATSCGLSYTTEDLAIIAKAIKKAWKRVINLSYHGDAEWVKRLNARDEVDKLLKDISTYALAKVKEFIDMYEEIKFWREI